MRSFVRKASNMAYFTSTFGKIYTTITIIGTNFIVNTSTTVKIGNNLATGVVINLNGDTITCKVPDGTGKQLVVVTTIYGPSTQQKYFTYADEIVTIENMLVVDVQPNVILTKDFCSAYQQYRT